MLYMGANQKDCQVAAEQINNFAAKNNVKNCYDITCGGANIIDKINCENLFASDISPTLIALHKAVQESVALPQKVDKQIWDDCYKYYKMLLKQKSPIKNLKQYEDYLAFIKCPYLLKDIGAIEWYGSFGHGGFAQGMAAGQRDFYNEALQNHLKQKEETKYQKIQFEVKNYKNVEFEKKSIIIAHINSAKPYQFNGKFNKFEFYKWALTKRNDYYFFIIDDNALIDIPQIEKLKNGKLYFLSKI